MQYIFLYISHDIYVDLVSLVACLGPCNIDFCGGSFCFMSWCLKYFVLLAPFVCLHIFS